MVTQADVKRGIRGVQAAGLSIAKVEIAPDGTIAIVIGEPSGSGVDDNWRSRQPGLRDTSWDDLIDRPAGPR